jgi:hypothetical protein
MLADVQKHLLILWQQQEQQQRRQQPQPLLAAGTHMRAVCGSVVSIMF